MTSDHPRGNVSGDFETDCGVCSVKRILMSCSLLQHGIIKKKEEVSNLKNKK